MPKYDYEITEGEYLFRASDIPEKPGDSLVEILKGTAVVKSFEFPSYKIWNIPAHAQDIIAGLEKGNDSGLRISGSDGLGGNSYGG
jgi:hypothetical protein